MREYLNFAIETAVSAGQSTLAHFRNGIATELKSDDSPVTIADRQAEELIRAAIERRYPEHAILGEEFGEIRVGRSHRWIVDPIDGTRFFARGISHYGVLLALEIEGNCEAGVAYFPALNELVAAATGCGCFWNGRPARVSETPSLRQGTVLFSDAKFFHQQDRVDAWARIQQAAGSCLGLGDAYGYLLVATGRAELMIDPIMAVWDCAPFLPILKEAGGFCGDWKGQETIHSKELLATTPILLKEVLSLLNDG